MYGTSMLQTTSKLSALKKVSNATSNPIVSLPRPHKSPSTLKLSSWKKELQTDPDKDFLLDGITNGFRIIKGNAELLPTEVGNYKSTTEPQVKQKVEAQILVELKEGNYVVTPNKPTIVSALGAIPKPNSDKIRLIHDCSRPKELSVNSYAETEHFRYQTIDDAVKHLKQGYYMAKLDLHAAYRSVKIHPDCYLATGLKWKFEGHSDYIYMYDERLPFGASCSPGIFDRLTRSINRMMARRGYVIISYLDDFLIISKDYVTCKTALATLIALVRELGFQINWSKVEGPVQHIVFLGICINSVDMSLSLPQTKQQEFINLLYSFSTRKRATQRQLQALAGKLNWACQVIRGGRTFIRRVLDAMNMFHSPTQKHKLTAEFHADIQWWLLFMQHFNGKAYYPSPYPITSAHVDACNQGGGMYYQGDWAYINWQQDWPAASNLHINYKETLAIVAAAIKWAPLWANHKVIIYTDSTTAKALINKGTTRNKYVMPALRDLFWLSVAFNFELKAVHIAGHQNTIADTISRLDTKSWPELYKVLYPELTSVVPVSNQFLDTVHHHMSWTTLCYLCRKQKPSAARHADATGGLL
jgi:hypothetical protein